MDRINHPTAVDIGGGRMGFRSKDTVAGVPGTVVTATHMNAEQEEIMAVIEAADLVPDDADLAQLLSGTRSQAANYRPAGGTANALTFTSTRPVTALPPGHVFRFRTGAAGNTAACTFKVDALPAAPLLKRDGGALIGGDLLPMTPYEAIHIGGNFYLTSFVLSDITGQKTLFNVQQSPTNTRQNMNGGAGNGYTVTAFTPANYVKLSASSKLLALLVAPSFTPGAAGASAAILTIGGQSKEVVASNAQPATSAGPTVVNHVFVGLAAASHSISLSYKRYDATAWNTVYLPNNSDAGYLPATSTVSLIVGEFE